MFQDFRTTIIWFVIGLTLGFTMGVFSPKVYASDPNNDAYCLAKNIYFEAGNQPLAGKLAVAHVVKNRMESWQFPDNYCDVIYEIGKALKATHFFNFQRQPTCPIKK